MSEKNCKYMIEPGVLDIRKLQADGLYPSDERISQGPIAVLECGQQIPCNPCQTACSKDCIKIGQDITQIPILDPRCTGCGKCLPDCPGLAIFILNGAYSETQASITLPYELIPLPEPGQRVVGLDRRGMPVCQATIVDVRQMKKDERCYSVTVAIPKRHIHDVRHIRSKEQ